MDNKNAPVIFLWAGVAVCVLLVIWMINATSF